MSRDLLSNRLTFLLLFVNWRAWQGCLGMEMGDALQGVVAWELDGYHDVVLGLSGLEN